MSNYPGKLITVEGIDGSGKSTVVEGLSETFDDVVVTKEPSPLATGETVRDSIESSDVPAFTTFFQFLADRVNHLEQTIIPALEDGKVVISDRFGDSTRVYQLNSLSDNPSHFTVVKDYIEETMEPWKVEPDCTIYLDISVSTAMERCDCEDVYENRGTLSRVKTNYELINKEHSGRVTEVNAERPREDVVSECIDILEQEVV